MRERLIELIAEGLRMHRDGEGEFLIDCIADALLANGVIVPPCKVGDTVYIPIITDDTKEPVVWEIIITSVDATMSENRGGGGWVIGHLKNSNCGESADFSDFGKTVFLTKEDAENALKERERV